MAKRACRSQAPRRAPRPAILLCGSDCEHPQQEERENSKRRAHWLASGVSVSHPFQKAVGERPGIMRANHWVMVRTTLADGRLIKVGSLFSLSTASSYCGSVLNISLGTMCTTLKPSW
jgi:hypothetical protein